MKSCVGCKHMVRAVVTGSAICKAGEEWKRVESRNAYSNKLEVRYINTGIDPGILRETDNERRAVGGACGPERLLYEPGLWQRIKRSLGMKTNT